MCPNTNIYNLRYLRLRAERAISNNVNEKSELSDIIDTNH
jgi:hypothetical protein